MADELRDGRSEGSWENFLYFVAREWIDAGGVQLRDWRRRAEAEAGVEHLSSRTAMRVPAQVITLDRLAAFGGTALEQQVAHHRDEPRVDAGGRRARVGQAQRLGRRPGLGV